VLFDDLKEHRDVILDRWIESVFGQYPEETSRFLRQQPDRFANPVGASLREGLADLLDGVIRGAEDQEFESPLDDVIRVRAVQEFSPSAAVEFVFALKKIVREELAVSGREETTEATAFDSAIDHLGLLAFDVYMSCREQLWAIRAKQIRNESVGIMERVAEWRADKEKIRENAP
jgi:hypothetical protein